MQTRREFLSSTVAGAVASSLILVPVVVRADENWAVKMFEKTSHDFGVVARGSDVSYRLKLKNLYKEDVHIADVRTTCGCSAGEPSHTTLKSLDEAYVEIKMDTRKFMRRKDSNVIVTFDAPLYQEVTVPITAYIRTDVVVEPGSAQFGRVDQETGGERILKVAYAGRSDWKIRSVKSGHEFLDATVKETARETGRVDYDLIVTLKPGVPIGALRHFVTLVTDDAENPDVPILVEAEVKPDIEVNPSVVALGTMAPGESKTVSVVLRGKKPFKVESVTCLKVKDVFEVRLPSNAAPVQVIPLTVTAPQTPGATLDEQLSIAIDGRKEPVTFRAYGKISGSGS
ncbi:DUF1573 domain-containing protein [bacterium]|nr:DUF1573 domain-containing protein [bacterium]